LPQLLPGSVPVYRWRLDDAGGRFINHADDELVMLEALVGRKPAFVKR